MPRASRYEHNHGEHLLRLVREDLKPSADQTTKIEHSIRCHDLLSAEMLIVETMEQKLNVGAITNHTAEEILKHVRLSPQEITRLRARSAQLY